MSAAFTTAVRNANDGIVAETLSKLESVTNNLDMLNRDIHQRYDLIQVAEGARLAEMQLGERLVEILYFLTKDLPVEGVPNYQKTLDPYAPYEPIALPDYLRRAALVPEAGTRNSVTVHRKKHDEQGELVGATLRFPHYAYTYKGEAQSVVEVTDGDAPKGSIQVYLTEDDLRELQYRVGVLLDTPQAPEE